ncbi:MAG: transposase family protein [Enterococcaceae bacterium]|nr:transposase family protein [Enterococcaceae bacterium]MCI1919168.1 transposase family protein [Enterococcaceae bacterium]
MTDKNLSFSFSKNWLTERKEDQLTVQILPIQSQKTILELKRSRFLCKECGAMFSGQTPLVQSAARPDDESLQKSESPKVSAAEAALEAPFKRFR